jgi:hypothetical protein
MRYHVVVIYDGEEIYNDVVEARSIDNAEEIVCDQIYDNGIINPYLYEVDIRLDYRIEVA